MATSLQQFLTTTQKHSLRTTNLFELELMPPVAVQNADPTGWSLAKEITIFGNGFELPSRTQNYATVQFKGYGVPIPTNISMTTDHTITIKADSDGKLRNFFINWMNYVSDSTTESSFTFGEKTYDPTSVIKVHLLDPETGLETQEVYTMYGVRIASVGGFTVSNENVGVATFTVGFKSVYWDHSIN